MKKLVVLFLFILFSCDKQEEIPKVLNYSFNYLNNNWDKKEIERFKNINENDPAPRNYHFRIGMLIRNNLLRHNAKSDSIVLFFNDLGINHYDYMSGIILTSYHRYLNKSDIRLKEQVNKILDLLKTTIDCENKRKEKAEKLYSKFHVNDNIQVEMPVDIISNENSVISYDCPSENWEFRNQIDLKINGLITKKYTELDSFSDNLKSVYKRYHFKIKILKMNNPETNYFMEKIKVGDEIEFSLDCSFKIK
ncbi:DUF6794 domain-containing protein [uncultured Tenacibaculum sp.]|uniref:DUF6794 domain-containing protein n=1 Tax=uncultured Tenacibaculum sp. TaxID=174713 RepID=UPI002618F695|nr:DUF6794 domain-containing protein [uncultured Tenacibaculum sp.]